MSTCARCGRPDCALAEAGDDCEGALWPATVECREAELANLHSLLRSVTRRLEHAECLLAEVPMPTAGTERARAEIDAVLEALS